MELDHKRQIVLVVSMFIFSLIFIGVTNSIFSYSNIGLNEKLVTGDIYMHYKESNTLIIENALPSSTYDETKYFEFTIDGKNTNTKYDIIYDITLNHGDAHETRTERLNDKFLKFTLMEKKQGEENWTTVVDAKSYSDLSSGIRVWKDTINKNTMNEVVHTYRLYCWIDNSVVVGNTNEADYNQDTWNNQIYASVKVTVTGDFKDKEILPQVGDKLSSVISKKLTTTNDVPDNYVLDETDNTKYISGCSDKTTDAACTDKNTIDFNFVWYSGKLWRVVAIYGDNTMKLITENPITAIYWGSNTTYEGSWVYQWLNEDFNDTLVNKNTVLATGKQWNATETTTTTKPVETTMVGGNVGLLNAYEYTNSYTKAGSYDKGYLNINKFWWLITPYSSSYVRSVSRGNLVTGGPSGETCAVRPSIYLSSSITFAGGEGTRNNPYKIGEDISAPTTNALLNSRVSGEYVNFKGEDFRIVGVENGTSKIVKADYILNGSPALKKNIATTVYFGKTGNTQSATYWDYYLNNIWLPTSDTTNRVLLDKGTYYLGEYGSTGISYKATICDRTIEGNLNKRINGTNATNTCTRIQNTESITKNTYTGYVGLLRVGEMFSSQLKGALSSYQYMWLITPYSSSYVRIVTAFGNLHVSSPSGDTFAVRPTVNLKSNVIITSGDGTEQHPFEIALSS